jgi:hypothetical protein
LFFEGADAAILLGSDFGAATTGGAGGSGIGTFPIIDTIWLIAPGLFIFIRRREAMVPSSASRM